MVDRFCGAPVARITRIRWRLLACLTARLAVAIVMNGGPVN